MRRREIILGLLMAVFIAVLLSPLASSWPDGLERVVRKFGFIGKGESAFAVPAPIPDYLFPGMKNEFLATAAAGLIGTLLMFGIGCLVASALKRRKGDSGK